MLDEATRQRIMLHQEGAVLANVGNSDASTACEVAQCQLDGIANALIRIQGPKETASFVFALSDRVSGGVRDVTDYLPPYIGGGENIELQDIPPAPPPPVTPSRRVPEFAWGFLSGLAVMLIVTMLAMGRV